MSNERWLRCKEIRDKHRQEREEMLAQRITLHFVDELSENKRTFEVPVAFACYHIVEWMASFGFLAQSYHCKRRYYIRELQGYDSHTKIKDTSLQDGDTLHIAFQDADLLKQYDAVEYFLNKYSVSVQWRIIEDRFCNLHGFPPNGTAVLACHGYDTKQDIEEMLRCRYIKHSDYLEFTINQDCWSACRNGDTEEVQYLCQLTGDPNVSLFADAVATEMDL